ncbi:MAG: MaoC family dehydratase [Acidimicrobiales bacterium]|nr:MaoC family dehydratase [Acidimicrobiales bacterium]
MDQPDFSTFPLARKGRSFEAFAEGQGYQHHWGRTLTDGDNALFCTATCNWNPMHLNTEYARAQGHPDVVINPMLVLCTVIGLSVEDLSEAGGLFLGMEDCIFHRSVHPGDTLTARSTVLEARTSSSRPNAGIVTWHTEAFNQHGELVVDFRRTNLVVRRRRGIEDG